MNKPTRIVSFLPSATEIACALGLFDQLVGITHECDYPPEVIGKPVVVRNALPIEQMNQAEIDDAVAERMRGGDSLYLVDERLLRTLAPDLILTQDLCQVCAPSGNEVSQALKTLGSKPEVLWLTPLTIDQIFDNIRDLGAATGRAVEAARLISAGRARLDEIAQQTSKLTTRRRVFCIEWLDPIYCSGHWVPEMVRLAGGIDASPHEGRDSTRFAWEEVLSWSPEVLIVMPCGFNLDKVIELTPQLFTRPGWRELPAVRQGRVYAVDANSYFARPGPRVVDGTELLAHLIYPKMFSWNGPSDAYRRVEC
jgi:iron complex transport system substrate-binding protein